MKVNGCGGVATGEQLMCIHDSLLAYNQHKDVDGYEYKPKN